MLMRRLGRTGLKVAALCLGGNTFGWTTDQKASEAVLDAYVEAGGNFIDTADVYSRWAPGNKGGESETVLGVWLTARKHRDAVLIATKVCGPMGTGPNDKGLSRAHIMAGVEASLRRLQTDYIDLYQAHWDDQETPLDETLHAFDDLVRQGKVRYVGASNYPAWRLTRALWESDRQRLQELLKTLEEKQKLVDLLAAYLDAKQEAVRVVIGLDEALPSMRNLVLIGAPARVGGEVMGSLAVIGPTRIDYQHTMTAVSYIARLFDKILNESE